MNFQLISLATALVGSSIAALWDLKTTEIPDEIPHAMIIIALVIYGVQSYLEWNYSPILSSAIVGLSLLALGFLMYHFGQWGGGDAKILSAIGFLLPQWPSQTMLPFPFNYLMNVFLVGAVYMFFYMVVLALLNRKIFTGFLKDIKANSKVFSFGSIGMFFAFLLLNIYLVKVFGIQTNTTFLISNSLIPLALTVCLYIVWRFAKVVEDVGFKRNIPISKLKIGDVPLESKRWDGITEKELKKIKRSDRKSIWIKEGVRFAPTFPLALLFTIYFGNGILLMMNFLV